MSCGAETVEEALEIYQQSKRIMSEGGFNLRKWKTNDKTLLSKLSELESQSASENQPKNDNEVQNVTEDDQTYTCRDSCRKHTTLNSQFLG